MSCLHHSGVTKSPLNKFYYPNHTFIFDAKVGIIKDINNETALERSSSTIVTGMHLAAFMGSKNIIIIGHDCGFIDGKMHIQGYDKSNAVMKGTNYVKWMQHAKVERKTLDARKLLKDFWGVNLYSLNPFINFGLEGHVYKRF